MVTEMLPIQADSIMNGLLYPSSSIVESYNQLDRLPAPVGHPHFDGVSVSANDVEGGASFSIGAFVRKPIMNGSTVTTELVVDMGVANQSQKGKEVLRRIKNKKRMGVSTGLSAQVINKKGTHADGEYFGIVNNIKFDHVAILLDEPPAGENTYTLNSKVHFNNKMKGNPMEIIIDGTELSLKQRKAVSMATATELYNALTKQVTDKEASTVLENSGKKVVDTRSYDEFITNKAEIAEWKADKQAKRAEKVEFVVTNSKMNAADLEEMSDSALDSLVDSVAPKNKYISNSVVVDDEFELPEGM